MYIHVHVSCMYTLVIFIAMVQVCVCTWIECGGTGAHTFMYTVHITIKHTCSTLTYIYTIHTHVCTPLLWKVRGGLKIPQDGNHTNRYRHIVVYVCTVIVLEVSPAPSHCCFNSLFHWDGTGWSENSTRWKSRKRV